jgi:UDP-N-acetylglucosamine diphosphorylase/glucosamine-1-phosphate N-acetyltransferase
MNIILFDDHYRTALLPFTFTRTAAQLLIGIDTIAEKWGRILSESLDLGESEVSFLTEDYLSEKYGVCYSSENFYINARIVPSFELMLAIENLNEEEVLFLNDEIIAFKSSKELSYMEIQEIEGTKLIDFELLLIHHWSELFLHNGAVLKTDFNQITEGRITQEIDVTNTVLGDKSLIFIEEGATVEAAILNTKNGPIYIGANAEIMEGSIVRGPFAMGEESTLKCATKIYGPTTLGPHCKVGGEVNNSILMGYSNKGHEGYLGNSVIGEWCNLGADTNNSNLKNNYGTVSCYNYTTEKMEETGLQFCGLAMGDHSKSGINTMFNTGTVVGVCANVFGSGFPLKHIPSFSWGGSEGFEKFRLDKSYEVAQRMMERRGLDLSIEDEQVLKYIFEHTMVD